MKICAYRVMRAVSCGQRFGKDKQHLEPEPCRDGLRTHLTERTGPRYRLELQVQIVAARKGDRLLIRGGTISVGLMMAAMAKNHETHVAATTHNPDSERLRMTHSSFYLH
jgi:hypothetical protein